MFLGKDLDEQLDKLVEFFGSADLLNYAKNMNHTIDEEMNRRLLAHIEKNTLWEVYCDSSNVHLFDESGFDLVNKLMCMDPVS